MQAICEFICGTPFVARTREVLFLIDNSRSNYEFVKKDVTQSRDKHITVRGKDELLYSVYHFTTDMSH